MKGTLSSKVINFPVPERIDLQSEIALLHADTADVSLDRFIKLIDEGCDDAYPFVGLIYEFGGRNVERDYAKARFYYELAVERTGAVAGYLGLIRIYFYGLDVEKDYCKALEYCEVLSEELDNPYANFYIGRMYMEGYCVEKDLEMAKEYFKRSWQGGYVFGLTFLGLVNQQTGQYLRGWIERIRAGIAGYRIARRDVDDPRICEI